MRQKVISFSSFNKTSVPANGGLRSFYIATKSTSFIYSNPTKALNEEISLILADGVYAPKILVGEGVVSYPMPKSNFLYQTKSFVGTVYYEEECPSPAPSISGKFLTGSSMINAQHEPPTHISRFISFSFISTTKQSTRGSISKSICATKQPTVGTAISRPEWNALLRAIVATHNPYGTD